MLLNAASSVYGVAVAWRQRWYARHPASQRRLSRPVISVGNIRAGGAGKTPIVAALANLLARHGEVPAVLTRGYARRSPADGVTVVSDRQRVLTGIDASGDEALMLARSLPGVPVLVGTDRYLSGCFAEETLGVTVHLLDDGFQHLALARDVDLLVSDEHDLVDRVIPAGQLREPLPAASRASALLTTATGDGLERLARALAVPRGFAVRRTIGTPRALRPGDRFTVPTGAAVFAVAGVARPQRFFDDLAAAGWNVAGRLDFRDHHRFDRRDMQRILESARQAGAAAVVTTEKDAVRMEAVAPADVPIAAVPLTATIEPDFEAWLLARLFEPPRPGTPA